jgi:hypothetical protein
MATVEITISNKTKGSLVTREKFQITRALAYEFIEKMEAMVADLPGRHRTRKRAAGNGGLVVEIELNADQDIPPPVISPTFRELFSSERMVNDAQSKS